MHVDLRYGTRGLSVELPDRNVVHVLRMNTLPVLDDRPTLEMLREMRGPLEPREPWDEETGIP